MGKKRKMKKERPKIGILGGMGPQASAHLVKLLVDISAKEFGAKNNDDFPEILLDSVPIPDFICDESKKEIGWKMFQQRIKSMDKIGIGIFAISCNTVHILLNQLQLATKVQFISMIDEIVKEVRSLGAKKVGLLASPTTCKSRIFHQAFQPERGVWSERSVYCEAIKSSITHVGNDY